MADTATHQNDAAPFEDPLDIATRRYYFKPMAAFFNAFHLRAFKTADIQWKAPVLDVGCSDGEYGVMLAEALGPPGEMIGIDLSAEAIQQAGEKARALYKEMICANATALPFDDESFHTVVSNASMLSIDPGLDRALREVHRVLKPGGSFYASVCTDQYEQNYWITRLLKGLGCTGWARRYMDAMNRRMQQAHLYAPDRWVALFEAGGFEVKQHFGFLPLSHTPLWSFLAWTPLRLHGIVKLIPCAPLHRGLSALYKKWFGGIYRRTALKLPPEQCGYIFIEAVKP